MYLVWVEKKYPDELRADFQQYYGLNLDGMGVDYSYQHAAVLVTQLPPNCRVFQQDNPDLIWTTETWFLAQIEHDLRVLAWQNTKDAQKRRNFPKFVKTPKEYAEERKRLENFDLDLVNTVLGLGGE